MDINRFWHLIDDARAQVADPADAEAVAAQAVVILAAQDPEEIVEAQQRFWDLMAASYRAPLWAAAYQINGGCSDDGFEYFRGWLIAQGRTVFEQAVGDPDSLADHPAVLAAADGGDLECEDVLGIAWEAYKRATGEELPGGSFTISYPALDPDWRFCFDDPSEIARRLPRLDALF
ncbi:hypothetical protein SRB5_46330 [Streptomyces sp. RB5]|uniref:DUF4240 domain-containing protein n=1 Tax=Streptomyces smaragdinus TaxID=2585196 RepID=A0A7K0CLV7_9ACTN|nr:DUF4240 domain-containing protein [Streptomyces smaragdinus]MQY14466.1 hypothetical protein [Streptomyces smaragdinus]